MKTRDEYAATAERLADQANHFTYGDGADAVTGGALATEALVYATLAAAAPAAENAELDILRVAVAELLHDAATSADDQAAEVISRFRDGLADTTYGERVLAVAAELMAAEDDGPTIEDAMTAEEMREHDQAIEYALDAADEARWAAEDEQSGDDQ